jgi:hypothetical protein
MGIFNKKLDYTSGNGVLPKVKPEEYSTLKLPNTSMMRVPNMNLMVKERDQGNLEKAFGASIQAFSAPENEAECTFIIEKYLGALRARMAPSLDDDATHMLAKLVGIGCGMAVVESKSGLMVPGKCHPSILNVIFRFTMNMGDEITSHFKAIPAFQQLIETAIEVGYVGARMKGSPSPEEMLGSVRANQ